MIEVCVLLPLRVLEQCDEWFVAFSSNNLAPGSFFAHQSVTSLPSLHLGAANANAADADDASTADVKRPQQPIARPKTLRFTADVIDPPSVDQRDAG
jgi:hypothetical protein